MDATRFLDNSNTGNPRLMVSSSADLEAMISRVARGDRSAFAELYNATSPKLYGIVVRIVKQQQLSEEVLQEVYINIWRQANRFDLNRAAPMTWMSIIARSRAIDEIRKHSVLTETRQLNPDSIVDTGQPTPARYADLNDDLRRLSNCLDELETNRGEAIKLAYMEGYTRQELADRFSQPLGSIKTWIHRGLKQLRECLDS